MKIKRCLKLLFRQTLYALALILWVVLVVVVVIVVFARLLLLQGQREICLRFCQCFF